MNAKAETRHKAQQAIGRDGIVLLQVAIQCGLAHCAIAIKLHANQACRVRVMDTRKILRMKWMKPNTTMAVQYVVPQTQPVVENI